MARIALSFWGLCARFEQHRFEMLDTPDGHRYGRPIMVDALLARGHEVFALQEMRESIPYLGLQYIHKDAFPDVDIVFLEHRWPTFKNDVTHPQHIATRYEPDLDRQREIIEFYRDKCPIIVWDTDLKITPEYEERYPELILTDPSFETNKQTRERVSLPFWSDWKELFPVFDPYPLYTYVGNNYERPLEFEKYFFSIQHSARLMGVQVSMYGNWLQKSPERNHANHLIRAQQEVAFNHRMNFYESMQIMNRSICTTHVSKPRYYQTGFISPRYVEALACNCPALVPSAQAYNGILGCDWIVSDGFGVLDCIRRIRDLTFDQRVEVIQTQRDYMERTGKFDVSNVVSFIESRMS